jgi:hypothetical protein
MWRRSNRRRGRGRRRIGCGSGSNTCGGEISDVDTCSDTCGGEIGGGGGGGGPCCGVENVDGYADEIEVVGS